MNKTKKLLVVLLIVILINPLSLFPQVFLAPIGISDSDTKVDYDLYVTGFIHDINNKPDGELNFDPKMLFEAANPDNIERLTTVLLKKATMRSSNNRMSAYAGLLVLLPKIILLAEAFDESHPDGDKYALFENMNDKLKLFLTSYINYFNFNDDIDDKDKLEDMVIKSKMLEDPLVSALIVKLIFEYQKSFDKLTTREMELITKVTPVLIKQTDTKYFELIKKVPDIEGEVKGGILDNPLIALLVMGIVFGDKSYYEELKPYEEKVIAAFAPALLKQNDGRYFKIMENIVAIIKDKDKLLAAAIQKAVTPDKNIFEIFTELEGEKECKDTAFVIILKQSMSHYCSELRLIYAQDALNQEIARRVAENPYLACFIYDIFAPVWESRDEDSTIRKIAFEKLLSVIKPLVELIKNPTDKNIHPGLIMDTITKVVRPILEKFIKANERDVPVVDELVKKSGILKENVIADPIAIYITSLSRSGEYSKRFEKILGSLPLSHVVIPDNQDESSESL